ncbi:MAG: AI-2E family transporter [Deltaproteobacteria bacterium]|nr:AI-2E family transporter [Deltaproteobacteria bacterium]
MPTRRPAALPAPSAQARQAPGAAPHDPGALDALPWVTRRLATRLVSVTLVGFLLIYLKSILIPLVLAILLAFLLSPAIARLTSFGVPRALSIVTAQALAVVVLLGAFMSFAMTVGPLSRELPKYRDALVHEITDGVEWVSGRIKSEKAREALKAEISESVLPKAIDQGVKLTQQGLSVTTSALGYYFLTLLLSTFLLLEAAHLREKVIEAYSAEHPVLISLRDIGADVRAYVVAKSLIGLLTSACVWALLRATGVDFAFFWALIAFPLNFIPTVGAVIASLPPVLVAIIDPDLPRASMWAVVAGLVLINAIIGSVLDPRYVGQKVKLSPLVVLLSMLLWGVLWGPIGMILAVPIMVSVKVIFSHTRGLEPVAILMRG